MLGMGVSSTGPPAQSLPGSLLPLPWAPPPAGAATAGEGGGGGAAGGVGDKNSSDMSPFSSMTLAELREFHREMLRNFTHHVNDPAFDLLRSAAWRGLVLTLYICVILIGMVGNTIVVFVVIRNKKMQNVTNVLIANLALSDIGLCIFSLPIQLYYQLTDHWMFGEVMCRIIFAGFAIPMYVSILTILLIAYDRYWLIIYPLRARLSIGTALLFVFLTFLTSLLLSIPVMCFTSLHQLDDPDLHLKRNYCVEQWPHPKARQTYSILMFTFQFCLPLSITAWLYYRIYRRLKDRGLHRSHCERKQKTNKILISIVVLFIICWLPWNIFSLITEMDHGIVKGPHFKFVDLLLKVFAMSSACVNPFLYCWLNDNFRRELETIAVKLHVYKEQNTRRHTHQPVAQQSPKQTDKKTLLPRSSPPQYGNFLMVPGLMENGHAISDTFLSVSMDRRSSARTSIDHLDPISCERRSSARVSIDQPSSVLFEPRRSSDLISIAGPLQSEGATPTAL